MKTFFTIIIVLSGLSLFSQIRLDSIVQTNQAGEVEKTSFEYVNEKLSKYTGVIQNDDLDVEFFYNINGDFESWNYIEDGNPLTLDFYYHANNVLDSFNVLSEDDPFVSFKYLFENDELQSITRSDIDDGIIEPEIRRDFSFSNGLVQSISSYDIANGSNDLFGKEFFTYNSNSRMTTHNLLDDTETYAVDSLSYEVDGSVIDYHRINFNNNVPFDTFKIEEYTSDPLSNFDNILTPVVFLEFMFYIVEEPILNKYFAIKNGNKIDLSTSDLFLGTATSEWYYSAYVGTSERVLTTPISVYPNPTVDQIRIESEETMTKFYIYDFAGALISEGSPGDDNAINVYHLSTGSYTVICSNKEDKHYFAQFVKQ